MQPWTDDEIAEVVERTLADRAELLEGMGGDLSDEEKLDFLEGMKIQHREVAQRACIQKEVERQDKLQREVIQLQDEMQRRTVGALKGARRRFMFRHPIKYAKMRWNKQSKVQVALHAYQEASYNGSTTPS